MPEFCFDQGSAAKSFEIEMADKNGRQWKSVLFEGKSQDFHQLVKLIALITHGAGDRQHDGARVVDEIFGIGRTAAHTDERNEIAEEIFSPGNVPARSRRSDDDIVAL